jgi:hypothetical protein
MPLANLQHLSPPGINFNGWYFGLNFPVLVLAFLLLCSNLRNIFFVKKHLSRQPYWLVYLAFTNILAQSLAYSLFYYELHITSQEILIIDGVEFSNQIWLPSFVSWFQAVTRHSLVLLLATVNFEILAIFSVFSSFLTLGFVKCLKIIFLSMYFLCLIYPTICDVTVIVYHSSALPSLYSPYLYAVLEFTGSSLLLLQDNFQNMYLFYILSRFISGQHKGLQKKSLIAALMILVAILIMDYLSIGMGVGLLLSPAQGTIWQLSPITAFLGIHALLLDVLFKVFKGIVGKNADSGTECGRFPLDDETSIPAATQSLSVGSFIAEAGSRDGIHQTMHPQVPPENEQSWDVQIGRRRQTFASSQPVIVQLGHPNHSWNQQYYH